ncbi:MAG: LTA synthase family protein [Acidimicrobiia bacterium]|nr:LTA synthase family protein [Acidimicrobiia bacterium]
MPRVRVPVRPLMVRAWGVVRWCLPALLLAVAPLMVVFGANLATVPLRQVVVVRSLLAVAGTVLLMLWGLRWAQRDLAARATFLAWFLLLFTMYEPAAQGLRAFGLQIWARDALFAVPYLVAITAIAALVSRPWETRPRDPVPLTLVGGFFVFIALAPAATAERPAAPLWRGAADAIIESALSKMPAAPAPPSRDIYYIVLDGMGRADTLLDKHAVDLEPLIATLRAKGFYVPDAARSNYSQTYLSLSSTLNMSHLQDIVRVVGTETDNRDPLQYLIQENALMRMAARAGYSIVAIGSDYMATQEFDRADVCVCRLEGLDEVELAAMALTPLAALPPSLWATDPYDAHRRKILDGFEALEAYTPSSRRSFVFAHIIAPHPPFVFGKDGRALRPSARYSLADWRGFGGTHEQYVKGYGEQTEFILRRTVAAIEAILRRPGPAPIIVVHGDHGPGSMVRWEKPSDENVRDRMAIFAAYYFPDGAADLYPTMTPLNGARVLARQFGAELPRLPDDSFFAEWNRPYVFMPVP